MDKFPDISAFETSRSVISALIMLLESGSCVYVWTEEMESFMHIFETGSPE